MALAPIAAIIAFFVPYFLWQARFSAFFQVTGATNGSLPIHVSRLRTTDVICTFLAIFVKYILRPFGYVPKLEVSNHDSALGTPVSLPALSLAAKLLIDATDEIAYDAATGQDGNNGRLMLIPALVNPLMSLLLANRNCPVFPLGCVNTSNRFEFIDLEACLDPRSVLDLPRANVRATFGGPSMPGRRVKRGIEFDLVIELSAARKGGGQNRPVYRQLGTFLTMLPNSTAIKKQPTPARGDDAPPIEQQPWRPAYRNLQMHSNAPWQWAALCRDYNPIHISAILAKVFGFPGKLAHGNHAISLATAQLLKDDKIWQQHVLESKRQVTLSVAFKRPMVLPIQMEIQQRSTLKAAEFKAVKRDKEMFSGKLDLAR